MNKIKTRMGTINVTTSAGKQLVAIEKGSRLWAFAMLDEGKKVRHEDWDKDVCAYIDHNNYIIKTNTILHHIDGFAYKEMSFFKKDGWELYEEKKTMTLRDLLTEENLGEKVKFKMYNTSIEDFEIYMTDGYSFFQQRENACSEYRWYPTDLMYLIAHLDKQVEITE